MKVIAADAFVKTTHLVDSNAGETVALWNSGTTYTLGQTARYADRIWESIKNSPANLNKVPTTETTYWLDVGPSNVMAMFDQQSSTTTTRTGTLVVAVNAPNVNAVAIINMAGVASITITGTDGVGGAEVYSATWESSDSAIVDWYSYFYLPVNTTADAIFADVPTLSTLVLTVTFTGVGEISVGVLFFGRLTTLGFTRMNPKVGIIDYSRKTTDDFGDTTFVPRAFSKRLSASVICLNKELNLILRTLTELRAKPSVWIGSDSPDLSSALIIYGFYRDFSVDIAYVEHSLCSLEIEGLT